MNEDIKLDIPNINNYLTPGCKVKLGRFSATLWIVNYGWYGWANNRKVCGWYLTDTLDEKTLKPLQDTDLDDIYIIER